MGWSELNLNYCCITPKILKVLLYGMSHGVVWSFVMQSLQLFYYYHYYFCVYVWKQKIHQNR